MVAAESIQGSPESAQVTLLLIEDVSVTAEIERSYFSSVGFNVMSAGNVVESQTIIGKEWVDVVIIDAAFARKKGLELIPLLRKESRNRDVKIIVTSVSGDPSLKKTATSAGASAFIVKPAPRPRYLKEIKKLSAQKARDTERVHQTLEVELSDGRNAFTAETLDVSSEGIHLAIHEKTATPGIGAIFQMTLQIEGKPLRIQGQVVRHTPKGVGIRFLNLGVQAQRALDKFLLRFSMEHQASHFYL